MPHRHAKAVSRFDRSRLPSPESFFRANLRKFRARGRKATALCPFHPDHHPSLSIDLDRGLFFCFTCNVGGDVISFVMLRDGVSSKVAAKSLGAWVDGELSPAERREIRRAKQRRAEIEAAAIDLAEREHRFCMHYRNEICRLERYIRYIRARLREFKPEQVDLDDYERCGVALVISLDRLREAVAAYYLLSFSTVGERADFVLHPEERARAIADVISRGFVRDDAGHVMEVEF
jgi:hypothetical protein